MASVWTTGADDLVNALASLDGPGFLGPGGRQASLAAAHAARKASRPLIRSTSSSGSVTRVATAEVQSDWGDLDEDDDAEEEFEVVSMALPGFPPLPAKRLPPLEFEDDFFEVYSDDFDDSDEYDDEEGEYGEASPLAYIAACYSRAPSLFPTQCWRSWRAVRMTRSTRVSSRYTARISPMRSRAHDSPFPIAWC